VLTYENVTVAITEKEVVVTVKVGDREVVTRIERGSGNLDTGSPQV
jgi:hypothetical protein